MMMMEGSVPPRLYLQHATIAPHHRASTHAAIELERRAFVPVFGLRWLGGARFRSCRL